MRVGRINTREVDALARESAIRRQVAAGAGQIRDEARRLAPFRTGALRRSLTIVEVRNPVTGAVEYRIGWDMSIAEYGPAVEFGTEDTAPQPHLRPAAYKARGR